MFKGRKTSLFWIGTGLLGASLVYFSISIYNLSTAALIDSTPLGEILAFGFPFLTGAIVFMIVSLFMMQHGTSKELIGKHLRRYWISLVTLGIASIYLLVTLWIGLVYYRLYTFEYWSNQLPFIAGPILFIALGTYGIKTGIKNKYSETTKMVMSK